MTDTKSVENDLLFVNDKLNLFSFLENKLENQNFTVKLGDYVIYDDQEYWVEKVSGISIFLKNNQTIKIISKFEPIIILKKNRLIELFHEKKNSFKFKYNIRKLSNEIKYK